MASLINREFFFHHARRALFDGRIRPSQFDGLSTLLDYWDANLSKCDDRWLAYALATTHHETNRTMQPIREAGGTQYKRMMYDVTGAKPAKAKKNGNTSAGDGVRYAGRGYVQLTWKNNYARAGKAVGIDLIKAPDRALDPKVAVVVLFKGMIEGWFTTHKLAEYFNPTTARWKEARKIVNGIDHADLIKGYALNYYAALSYTI